MALSRQQMSGFASHPYCNNDISNTLKHQNTTKAQMHCAETGLIMSEPKSMEQLNLEKDYEEYVKKITPTHNLYLQMLKAFITGGIICIVGQFLLNLASNQIGMDKETAGSFCSLILVLISVLLTGFNIYPSIVKFGGAGALVPITGFANSVAAPAVEFKKEGQVFGIGCKIFTIAGPVILYGIFTSWILGLCYWIGKALGWF